MSRVRLLVGMAAIVALVGSPLRASYTILPRSGGAAGLDVAPGESFPLNVILASDAGDRHNSAIFRVVFKEDGLPAPGLEYLSYSWASPYTTGSVWDDSHPQVSALPVALDANTLAGGGYSPGVVDLELSNVVPTGGGTFSEGSLATLGLKVPVAFAPGRTIMISIEPDTIANGFTEIATTAGPDFALHIVPEPAGIGLCLVGLVGLMVRRRGDRTGKA